MASRFELTPMSAFLKHRQEFFVIDDTERYMRVTARLHGQGVVLRDQVYGSQLRTKKQQATGAGDLLVAEIDAKVGGVGIIPPELTGAIVSSHYFLYEIDETVCCPKYLEYYIRSGAVEEQFQEFVQGSTNYASIRPHHTLELQIPLPPLDEQRRIVARIGELAALIEEAQGLRVKAREEAASLVSAAVVKLFTAHQGEHWCDYRLSDLVNEIRYGTSEKAHVEPSGTPILRMGNIQNGRLDLTDLKYLHLGDRDGEKLLLRPGDVLVNRTNSAELVGKCAVFEEEGKCTFASYLIRLRFDLTKAVPQFVAAYINSPIGRAYMFSERKQMTGQANVNSKTLKAMPISLPPVEEQNRIVAYLDELQAQVDELTALQDATQAELDALLPSVLDRAFRGEL
jgi:type I restriction enzyme S subunit